MIDTATIERLAREAGLECEDEMWFTPSPDPLDTFDVSTESLGRFAALVSARDARTIEVLRAERDHARARVDSAVRLLTGIHSLLYPAPIKTADGRTMVFRPKTLDPHEVLQELSDRIRAQSEPVACVTECEACFTPDACQLRGKCDHYAAEQLRVKKAPLYAAPVAAPVAAQGWQPIETAPRDGLLLLLCTDGGIVFVGKLNKHLQLWVDDQGRERFRTVTYWMPLPAPKEPA